MRFTHSWESLVKKQKEAPGFFPLINTCDRYSIQVDARLTAFRYSFNE
jgi:hypothetical protein